mgnify:FL=1
MSAVDSAQSAAGSAISPVTEIIAELRAGRMVILVDEEDRENEGDLVMAAEFITPEAINFMVTHARGLVCLTLTKEHCERLGLSPMVQVNGTRYGTNFTASIEAAEGVTTGISAADRAHTIRTAVARDAKPSDIVQPGHVFPIQAEPGGVLVRAGHTEAGCDLTALAGLTPAAVICEILKEDGTMARLPDLIEFARRHNLKIGTIVDLIQYRSETESMVHRVGERTIHTPYGPFHAVLYRDVPRGAPHLALIHGKVEPDAEILVRVHEPTSLLDLLDVRYSLHSWSLSDSLAKIAASPAGVAVLLNCAASAGQFFDEFAALNEMSQAGELSAPIDRSRSSDLRVYGIGAQILKDLGVTHMRLLGRPRRMPSMAGFSLSVTGFEPGPRSS